MMNQITTCLAALGLFLASTSLAAAAQQQAADRALSQRQQSIVAISALTAKGESDKLKPALNEALDAGLTVNEVHEVLVHVYAYAGFPRSFNGMLTFKAVMEDRKARGIEDELGRQASPVPANLDRDAYGARVRAQLSGLDEVPPPAAWQKFAPVLDRFLKEHLFADLFARDLLSFQDRELVTVAVLASISGVDGPLRYHLGAAMNVGLTKGQLKEFIAVIKAKVGPEAAERAGQVLDEVLKARSE